MGARANRVPLPLTIISHSLFAQLVKGGKTRSNAPTPTNASSLIRAFSIREALDAEAIKYRLVPVEKLTSMFGVEYQAINEKECDIVRRRLCGSDF